MAIVNGTDDQFKTETQEGLVLVDFWAAWCGPCKMIAPVLEELADDMGDSVKIVKMDVDANPKTTGDFGIMSIPTLLLMKDGEIKEKLVGFAPKEKLTELIVQHQ